MSLREEFRSKDSRAYAKHVDSRAFAVADFNPKPGIPEAPEDQFLMLMQGELLSGRYKTARALVLVKEASANEQLEAAAKAYDRITELAEIARSIRIAVAKTHNDLVAELWKIIDAKEYNELYTPIRDNALAIRRIYRVAVKASDFIFNELEAAAKAIEDLLPIFNELKATAKAIEDLLPNTADVS